MSAVYQCPKRIGLELTWVPYRRGAQWQEFRSEAEALRVAKAFNERIAKDEHIRAATAHYETTPGGLFKAKVDPFRSPVFGHSHWAFCIEVNSPGKISPKAFLPVLPDLSRSIDASAELRAVQSLYQIAPTLGLRPFVSSRSKRGVTREWPTGGGHIHLSTDMWSDGSDYLLRMFNLERGLCLDYANYPFIRWLWAQWFDDTNSELPFTEEKAAELDALIGRSESKRSRALTIAHDAVLQSHSIKQRMAYTGKGTYASYEFRFFDMPRSAEELSLQVQFLVSWLRSWGQMVDAVIDEEDPKRRVKADKAYLKRVRYKLTPEYMRRLREDLPFARVEVETFFRERLGLDYSQGFSDITWDRAYVKRALYGKAT